MVPRSIQRLFPNVKKCTDAKRPVEVTVKKSDVEKSESKNAEECAMALAICREWKADQAIIGMSFSYVIKGDTAIRFKTPESVQREIISFDRNHDFRAGTYHLNPSPPAQRLSNRKKR